MKKLLYLLLLVPFALLTSCDKDDDLQPFDLTLTLGGVTQSDGVFYAVSGDEVTIEGLTVKPLCDKQTTVANVLFSIDGALIFPNPWNATGTLTFPTEVLPLGRNAVNVTGNLLQVDQSIKNFVANFTIVVVESEDELPAGAPALGSYSQTITVNK